MQPLTPALLPQYQQFLAFSQARQESQASASQGDVSNHDLPAMNHQMTTPAVHVAEMHDFKPLEPATHAGSHEAEPGGGDLAASNAEPNCSNYTKPNSHSPATVEDGELGKPSWRQLLRLRMGCARGRRWLRYRKFVGTACLQLGISLNQPFCSYPYESQMDTITSITKLVGPKYGWDEELTRDVIRVLCFDRVTLNHKRKKEKKDQYHRVRQKKRAKIDPPLFRVDLQSGIREITLYFSQNTSYTCFKAAVFGNHLQLAPGEKLHYKARYGTQKDTELKPIMFKKDFIAMLKMNPNVGVMLHVCPDAELSKAVITPGKATPTLMSEIDDTPALTDPYVPTAEAISPVTVELKSVRKSNTITNGDKARPSGRKSRLKRRKQGKILKVLTNAK